MDARRLAAILIAAFNSVAEDIEKEMSADKDGGSDRPERSRSERPSRAKPDDDGDPPRRSRPRAVDDDDGEASEDDIVRATRAALKVLEQDDVQAIIKKHGKAPKATEVKASLRQAVIDALKKAVDAADED